MREDITNAIDEDKILAAIANKGKLYMSKNKRMSYLDVYVWRMIRFDTGYDMTFPFTAYFHLQRWIDQFCTMKEINVCGIINDNGCELINHLDAIIRSICNRLHLNDAVAACTYKQAGLF